MQEHTVSEAEQAGAPAQTERLYYTDSHLRVFDAQVRLKTKSQDDPGAFLIC